MAAHGHFNTSVANFYYRNGYVTTKQFNLIKKRIIKYAGQLTKIANGQIVMDKRPIKLNKNWLHTSK